ncbi:dipeptide ABC transporter ATP-binding protein [Curtobacterium flaccumfaciens]|uniref:dipeptide ABC transporter ATP-binding protein n=1 Tax=Curtobacterium flaccumfaciens TaxID=2035 RepID=UPI0015FF063E|nr:ABC transporter ATP-binding protein [Curtobacterium flaccumfaciens]MBB1197713.1 ABC transporter ATP-binding protein [Curtobacterium flaccumfaciens]
MTALLTVQDLRVAYRTARGDVTAVDGVDLEVAPGEVTALVGESGSGKSSVAQSVIGLLASNGRVAGGSIRLGDRELTGLSEREFRSVRGRAIGLVPQDPGNSLNPVATIGANIAEVLRIHGWKDRVKTRARVLELLERVDIDDPETRIRQYPHELSGGMRQRVLIAAAIALEPALVIADEPTSALDVTVQQRVLDLLDRLRTETGTGVLFITHDLAVAAERADRVVVMRNGTVQESGPADRVFSAPQSDYTRTLLTDAPSLTQVVVRDRPRADAADAAGRSGPPVRSDLLVVRDLRQEFPRRGATPLVAVDDVSFRVAVGTTHAIVGESGSGKTTTGRVVAGFARPTAGTVTVGETEVTALRSRRALRDLRRTTQLVYQNPYGSLDPRQSVRRIVREPLDNFRIGDAAERSDRVAEQLRHVGLAPEIADRLPRELSGGQRQRVAIARALVLEPRLVVLDEAVSALDVTVQAQILRLLARLQEELGLTYVFISHDLAVVRQIADTVSVLRRGVQVEHGTAEQVFDQPEHEYTRQLLAAIPGRAGRASVQPAQPATPAPQEPQEQQEQEAHA